MVSRSVIHRHHFRKPVTAVRFSPDGSLVAVLKDSRVLICCAPGRSVREFNPLQITRTFAVAHAHNTCLDWSADGRYVVSNEEPIVHVISFNHLCRALVVGSKDTNFCMYATTHWQTCELSHLADSTTRSSPAFSSTTLLTWVFFCLLVLPPTFTCHTVINNLMCRCTRWVRTGSLARGSATRTSVTCIRSCLLSTTANPTLPLAARDEAAPSRSATVSASASGRSARGRAGAGARPGGRGGDARADLTRGRAVADRRFGQRWTWSYPGRRSCQTENVCAARKKRARTEPAQQSKLGQINSACPPPPRELVRYKRVVKYALVFILSIFM